MTQVNSPKAIQRFNELRKESTALAGFKSPDKLTSFLKRPRNLEIDAVFRALIESARNKEHAVATNILLIGLSGPLKQIVIQQVRRFSRPEWEVVSQVIDIFLDEIHRIDLSAISGVATITLNTWRRVLRDQKRLSLDSDHERLLDDDETGRYGSLIPRESSLLKIPLGLSESEEIFALRAWLKSAAGPDADLIFRAIVAEEDRLTLAEELGISRETLRVRLHRACRLLGKKIDDVDCL